MDSGEDVYLNSHCRTDFGDVRFTKSDGSTLLDYWMEKYVASDYAIFWVEVADDLSTTAQIIYIYYGKSDATTTSNGENTFIFFDDFLGTSLDPSKWGSWILGSGTVEDGYLKLGTVGWNLILSVPSPSGNTRQYTKFIRKSTGTDFDLVFRATDGNNFYQTYVSSAGGFQYHRQYKNVGGTYTQIGSQVSFSPSVDTPYVEQSLAYGSTLKAYVDGQYFIYATDTTFASGKVGLKSWKEYWIDWVFVAKYVDPEPSHGAWGSEEAYENTAGGGVTIKLKNGGSLTVHVVSLWVNNATVHKRYDADVFINPGETMPYTRKDIALPESNYIIKVVTERGNIAVYSKE